MSILSRSPCFLASNFFGCLDKEKREQHHKVHFCQDSLVQIYKEGAMVMGLLLLADSSRDV